MSLNPFADIGPADGAKVAAEEDRIGGSFLWEGGAHEVTIKMAYADESGGGAKNMNFEVVNGAGKVFKFTEYVTGGREKGQKSYSEKDGVKTYLPGFNRANAICLLTTKQELGPNLGWEQKTLMLRDFDQKKDVPSERLVATALIGKKVILGIQLVEENKSVKGPDPKTGKERYLRTAETRQVNNVDKIFYAEDKRTVVEIRNKSEGHAFYDKWVAEFSGKIVDRVKPAETTAAAGGGAAAAKDPAPVDNLFD